MYPQVLALITLQRLDYYDLTPDLLLLDLNDIDIRACVIRMLTTLGPDAVAPIRWFALDHAHVDRSLLQLLEDIGRDGDSRTFNLCSEALLDIMMSISTTLVPVTLVHLLRLHGVDQLSMKTVLQAAELAKPAHVVDLKCSPPEHPLSATTLAHAKQAVTHNHPLSTALAALQRSGCLRSEDAVSDAATLILAACVLCLLGSLTWVLSRGRSSRKRRRHHHLPRPLHSQLAAGGSGGPKLSQTERWIRSFFWPQRRKLKISQLVSNTSTPQKDDRRTGKSKRGGGKEASPAAGKASGGKGGGGQVVKGKAASESKREIERRQKREKRRIEKQRRREEARRKEEERRKHYERREAERKRQEELRKKEEEAELQREIEDERRREALYHSRREEERRRREQKRKEEEKARQQREDERRKKIMKQDAHGSSKYHSSKQQQQQQHEPRKRSKAKKSRSASQRRRDLRNKQVQMAAAVQKNAAATETPQATTQSTQPSRTSYSSSPSKVEHNAKLNPLIQVPKTVTKLHKAKLHREDESMLNGDKWTGISPLHSTRRLAPKIQSSDDSELNRSKGSTSSFDVSPAGSGGKRKRGIEKSPLSSLLMTGGNGFMPSKIASKTSKDLNSTNPFGLSASSPWNPMTKRKIGTSFTGAGSGLDVNLTNPISLGSDDKLWIDGWRRRAEQRSIEKYLMSILFLVLFTTIHIRLMTSLTKT